MKTETIARPDLLLRRAVGTLGRMTMQTPKEWHLILEARRRGAGPKPDLNKDSIEYQRWAVRVNEIERQVIVEIQREAQGEAAASD